KVALARCFVLNRTEYSANAGVRHIWSEIRRAAVLFSEICGIVISQADVECELARHLPTVLRVKTQLMFSNASGRRRLGICCVDQAQKETGVWKSDRVSTNTSAGVGSNDIRKRGLCIAETVLAIQGAGVEVVVSLESSFVAELIRMVVPGPG